MNEKLLQYIWQFRYFNQISLQTIAGEPVRIIEPGTWNTNGGPDFQDARVEIAGMLLAGSVELHLKTTDWNRHKHSPDPAYRNVILHVVWQHDRALDHSIPVLELEPRIPHFLLERYAAMMQESRTIPCAASIGDADPLVWTGWKDRLIIERLLRKTEGMLQLLTECRGSWEECCWWLLARNFGMTVNAAHFEAVARSLPLKLLLRHRNSIHQLEALLLGQAGLLESPFNEDYPKLLQREYRYLQKKYGIRPVPGTVQFLRMRPGNFPTLRLAQLAMLLHSGISVFQRLLDAREVSEMAALLSVTANDYWHYHYRPDHPGSYLPKRLGASMVESILLNTIIPMLFAYGQYHHQDAYREKALQWLQELPSETNNVTAAFACLGVASQTAFDAQALLELKKSYCNVYRCLDCAIGAVIFNKAFKSAVLLPMHPS